MSNKLDESMEDYQHISETAVAIEAGRKIGELESGVEQFEADGLPYIAHSKELTVTKLADHKDLDGKPRRMKGGRSFAEVGSFCAFVSEHKEAGTTIQIGGVQAGQNVSFAAVINDHAKDAPGWGDFVAGLDLQPSDDFGIFFSLSMRPVSQREFVQILRNRIHCVVTPDCSVICGIFEHFTAKSSNSITSKIQSAGGNIQVTMSEEVHGQTNGNSKTVEVPETIVLQLPLFAHREETVELTALVNWNYSGGELTFGLAFPKIERIWEKAVQEVRQEVADATGLFVAM